MQVKIGNCIYDSEKEPIMVIVNAHEKELIGNMPGDKFCSYPEELEPNCIEQFMKIE